MDQTLLTFSGTIEASDTTRRVIAGKIVPFGEPGYTSVGKVVFERGSIAIPNERFKLLLEHDPKQPVGRAINVQETADGIYAQFKVAETTRGNDALIEASDLRDGLSVGVLVHKSVDRGDTLFVQSAELQEVSLVHTPAFKSAEVTTVAASESEPETPDNPTQPTESEAVVENPDTPAVEVEAEKVEASRPRVSVTAMEVRHPIRTKADYLQHTIKAALGNDDSRDYVKAADAQAAKSMTFADDSFTTNPAFSPVQYVSTVVDTLIGNRPAIDALGGSRPLAASGMTISIPKITTSGTVAETAEGGAPSETGIVSSYVNATVKKYAGLQRYSVELLERSSDNPSFFQAMLENMTRAYNKATDAAVIAEITSGGTQGTAVAATSAGIISFVSTEVPAAYSATGELPTVYIAGTSQWGLLMGATDTTGRPIYNAGSPYNSGGNANPQSLRGNVLGLDLYVDANMVATTIDESAFICVPSAIYIAESPVLRLSTNIPTSGEIETMLYGYLATKTLVSGGLRRFNLT
jgi:HK97 family phage prohead protease